MKRQYGAILLFVLIATGAQAQKTSLCLEAESIEELTDEATELLLAQCETEIAQEKERLINTQEQTRSRERDLARSEQSIHKSAAYIRARELEIKAIIHRIEDQKERVYEVEGRAEATRHSIAGLLRRKHELDDHSTLEAVFSAETLSSFFSNNNNFEIIRTSLQADHAAYLELKEMIILEQSELAEEESRQRELANQKELERGLLEHKRAEQKVLRDLSREQEKEYQALIKEKEAAKRALRSRLFTTASGEKVSFGEAYDIVAAFESDLNIDSAFVLAVLFQESGWGGEIGGNIGRCTYNQTNSHGGSRNGYQVMAKAQQANFIRIMEDLGLSAERQAVSCPIPSDGAYGGAMGPAQFMPNTWIGVRPQAARYLGVEPQSMSPFINRDAFIASGTFLRNFYYGQSCSQYASEYSHIRSKQSLREKCAAAHYYAGGNWWLYRNTYGESVQQRTERFRRDISTLND